ITPLLLSALLFSACQDSVSEPQVDLTLPLDELPVKTIDCEDLNTEFYRLACQEQVNRVAGQILAEEVMKTFDLSRCSELSYDSMENCKTQLQASGVQGPISLEQAEVLNQALQAIPSPSEEDPEEAPFP